MPKRKQYTAAAADRSEDEARIAKEIKQYAEAVRQKYLALRLGRQGVDETMTRMLKPVTTPLQQIEKHTKPKEIKTEAVKQEPIIIKRTPPRTPRTYAARAPWQPSIFTSTLVIPSFSSTSFIPPRHAEGTKEEEGEEEEGDSLDSTNLDVSGFPPMSQGFVEKRLNSKDKSVDRLFSPRPSAAGDGTWMLGNEVIKFLDSGDIQVGRGVYVGTPALYHFLFMKTMPPYYTDEDVTAYIRILLSSSVCRKGYDAMQPRAHTNTRKYINVISPMFHRAAELSRSGSSTSRIEGQGYKLVTDQTKDYVYYSDPNELVDRLRLLVAAEQAGNELTHHHNEIESILQELREMGIITA